MKNDFRVEREENTNKHYSILPSECWHSSRMSSLFMFMFLVLDFVFCLVWFGSLCLERLWRQGEVLCPALGLQQSQAALQAKGRVAGKQPGGKGSLGAV